MNEGNKPIGNSSNKVTGNYGLAFSDSIDYNSQMYQEIDLPDGTYTLEAKIKAAAAKTVFGCMQRVER